MQADGATHWPVIVNYYTRKQTHVAESLHADTQLYKKYIEKR